MNGEAFAEINKSSGFAIHNLLVEEKMISKWRIL